eukprot:3286854-Ditylum_brightwellii.AAC.1
MTLTPLIIKKVHTLVEIDGMPNGKKLTNPADNVLSDSAWTTGVSYQEKLFDDDNYTTDEGRNEDNSNCDDD